MWCIWCSSNAPHFSHFSSNLLHPLVVIPGENPEALSWSSSVLPEKQQCIYWNTIMSPCYCSFVIYCDRACDNCMCLQFPFVAIELNIGPFKSNSILFFVEINYFGKHVKCPMNLLQVQHNFTEKFYRQTFQIILKLFILYFRPETGFGCSSQPESLDVNVFSLFYVWDLHQSRES